MYTTLKFFSCVTTYFFLVLRFIFQYGSVCVLYSDVTPVQNLVLLLAAARLAVLPITISCVLDVASVLSERLRKSSVDCIETPMMARYSSGFCILFCLVSASSFSANLNFL